MAQAIAAADVLISADPLQRPSHGSNGGALKTWASAPSQSGGSLTCTWAATPSTAWAPRPCFTRRRSRAKPTPPAWRSWRTAVPFDLWHINGNDEIEWDPREVRHLPGLLRRHGLRGILDIRRSLRRPRRRLRDACWPTRGGGEGQRSATSNMALDVRPPAIAATTLTFPSCPTWGSSPARTPWPSTWPASTPPDGPSAIAGSPPRRWRPTTRETVSSRRRPPPSHGRARSPA